MIPVWWQLLANISSFASSTPSAVLDLSYIRTQTYIRSPCHRQLLFMVTDLICGKNQLSHHIHHIFFPLSQKVDTTSNPVIGEGVNAPALWPSGVAQFMVKNPSPVLACHTDCYEKNFSVTGFCHQDFLRASCFCRMTGMYEAHRVRLLVSTEENSSRLIMWLLVKFSFDINDHIILSMFLKKMRQFDGSLHLFDTLHESSH